MPKNPVMAKGIEAMKRILVLKAVETFPFVRASEFASPRAHVGQADAVGTIAKQASSTADLMNHRSMEALT